ncbi:MAG: hypothetical protein QOJ57_812 [Thermoleophilaceae bacterium]|nr:hypothetical protein [Thermoleophilaceae bacterium]
MPFYGWVIVYIVSPFVVLAGSMFHVGTGALLLSPDSR